MWLLNRLVIYAKKKNLILCFVTTYNRVVHTLAILHINVWLKDRHGTIL